MWENSQYAPPHPESEHAAIYMTQGTSIWRRHISHGLKDDRMITTFCEELWRLLTHCTQKHKHKCILVRGGRKQRYNDHWWGRWNGQEYTAISISGRDHWLITSAVLGQFTFCRICIWQYYHLDVDLDPGFPPSSVTNDHHCFKEASRYNIGDFLIKRGSFLGAVLQFWYHA